MGDFPVFDNFLSTKCGLAVNIKRNKTVVFVNILTAPLTSSDVDIDNFVKILHAKNSAHPANRKILIAASAIVDLKALIFELEDRSRCGALPVLATL